ncbi:MAG TPA: hypothetical protein VHN99_02925 [Deinococcales bacterium]|nr:hypothetical protein [Deinococcales bacterium]
MNLKPFVLAAVAISGAAAAAPLLGNPVSGVASSDFCKVLKCQASPATSVTLKSGEKLAVTAYRLQGLKNPTVVSIASTADGKAKLAVASWYRAKTLDDYAVIPALTAYLTGAKIQAKDLQDCLTATADKTVAKILSYKNFAATLECQRVVTAPKSASTAAALLYPKTTLTITLEEPKASGTTPKATGTTGGTAPKSTGTTGGTGTGGK